MAPPHPILHPDDVIYNSIYNSLTWWGHHGRPDDDGEIGRTVGTEIPYTTWIYTPGLLFEPWHISFFCILHKMSTRRYSLLKDMYGSNFRSTRHGPRWHHGPQNFHRIQRPWHMSMLSDCVSMPPTLSLCRHRGDQLMNRGVALHIHQFWHLDRSDLADLSQIVSDEIYDHEVLREVLGITAKVFFHLQYHSKFIFFSNIYIHFIW